MQKHCSKICATTSRKRFNNTITRCECSQRNTTIKCASFASTFKRVRPQQCHGRTPHHAQPRDRTGGRTCHVTLTRALTPDPPPEVVDREEEETLTTQEEARTLRTQEEPAPQEETRTSTASRMTLHPPADRPPSRHPILTRIIPDRDAAP